MVCVADESPSKMRLTEPDTFFSSSICEYLNLKSLLPLRKELRWWVIPGQSGILTRKHQVGPSHRVTYIMKGLESGT